MKRGHQCIPGRGNSGVRAQVEKFSVLKRQQESQDDLEAETQRMLGGQAGEASRNMGCCVACSGDLEGNSVNIDQDGSQRHRTPLEPQAWTW